MVTGLHWNASVEVILKYDIPVSNLQLSSKILDIRRLNELKTSQTLTSLA